MIASLRGSLAETYAEYIVIDVGGVGYRVFVSQNAMRALPAVGQEVRMFIHTHLREDALLLFGFNSLAEKEAFTLLTSVSGVGPRLALAVLSVHTPENLARAVYNQDLKALTRVSGVGKKTAERILLELRDRLKMPIGPDSEPSEVSAAAPTGSGAAYDAIEALIALGYARTEAEQAIRAALAVVGDKESDTSELVRMALRRMSTTA